MTTPMNADTTEPTHKPHSIRLYFDDTPEDQALYAALCASSGYELRTPLSRHVKYQLKMAMGVRPLDYNIVKRMGLVSGAPDGDPDNAAAAEVSPAPTRPATMLRLIPGDDVEIHYDIMGDSDHGAGREFLDSWISSKAKALRILREQRKLHPEAYLVKCVRTRYRLVAQRHASTKKGR